MNYRYAPDELDENDELEDIGRDQNGVYGTRTDPDADSRVQMLNSTIPNHTESNNLHDTVFLEYGVYTGLCYRSRTAMT